MDKEELIKLIEAMTIEEINSLSITYFTEKQKSNYGFSSERELKTISYGNDINKKIEYIRRDMESMFERTQINNQLIMEEMVNEKLNKE